MMKHALYRNLFKKLYTLSQFLFINYISQNNELLELKVKELEEEIKEDFEKTPEMKTLLQGLSEEKIKYDDLKKNKPEEISEEFEGNEIV